MIKRRFICHKCERTFMIEVLEPGEAESRRVRPVAVRCPQCGGPVELAK